MSCRNVLCARHRRSGLHTRIFLRVGCRSCCVRRGVLLPVGLVHSGGVPGGRLSLPGGRIGARVDRVCCRVQVGSRCLYLCLPGKCIHPFHYFSLIAIDHTYIQARSGVGHHHVRRLHGGILLRGRLAECVWRHQYDWYAKQYMPVLLDGAYCALFSNFLSMSMIFSPFFLFLCCSSMILCNAICSCSCRRRQPSRQHIGRLGLFRRLEWCGHGSHV